MVDVLSQLADAAIILVAISLICHSKTLPFKTARGILGPGKAISRPSPSFDDVSPKIVISMAGKADGTPDCCERLSLVMKTRKRISPLGCQSANSCSRMIVRTHHRSHAAVDRIGIRREVELGERPVVAVRMAKPCEILIDNAVFVPSSTYRKCSCPYRTKCFPTELSSLPHSIH